MHVASAPAAAKHDEPWMQSSPDKAREYGVAALNRALDLYTDQSHWRQMVRNGMRQDFSWDRQGEKYVDLYKKLSAA